MNETTRRALLIVGAGTLVGIIAVVGIAMLLLHTVIHSTRASTTLFVYAGVLFAIGFPLMVIGNILTLISARKRRR